MEVSPTKYIKANVTGKARPTDGNSFPISVSFTAKVKFQNFARNGSSKENRTVKAALAYEWGPTETEFKKGPWMSEQKTDKPNSFFIVDLRKHGRINNKRTKENSSTTY